ncbi:ABC transporter substrate-binding protein [Shewanella sp. 1_MG-2023]|uniref:ABC transporter substrate-binding protein n=1 Tax=unclassified Shewanella TaxID=196818 RepID=UPI0026E199D4|nr:MULTISPECIES: ABC transporter substrate-binding protein [unclassified Shewanella]MDO6612178.1 ABC transporter substrate-binding protein [Shewanella sp. 7_MG-2023]MDO6772032.1 ABC transporter substrate-binding protein [Shewanella sp. 2_MG-2023]MDO6795772.1 ABC transporter substrate-binding protein [Shewanella sp. 1_MG-2023]
MQKLIPLLNTSIVIITKVLLRVVVSVTLSTAVVATTVSAAEPQIFDKADPQGKLLVNSQLDHTQQDTYEQQLNPQQLQWLKSEFQPSTLSLAEQKQEMLWFQHKAQAFKGMEIRVVSERINTHQYEANVLAKAFFDITGIHVIHELTNEDDVIKKFSAQLMTGQRLYDAYISDSDLIGSHFRQQHVMSITDLINHHAKDFTLPTLDLSDFIGLAFTTGPDGKIYQLPDQQFANLYWYRSDWFANSDYQKRFESKYGYPLGIPQNWQAYEDIANFFTNDIGEIAGTKVYGHMDYAKSDPSLGWRISDAWLSMAGVGDKGLPNGLPVDEWGIRVEDCRPVGASVERGGALNSPAAIYAIEKYKEWLIKYAPPEAKQLTFSESGDWAAKGNIAQQIFWYTAFVPDYTKKGLSVMNNDGTPKWRVAPSPVGKYWQKGMKSGYQDTGAWTFLNHTPDENQIAAWLYAQFVVSKTVSLKKTLVGATPIRQSDIASDIMTEQAPYLGGLVEFYRSHARDVWTPTGTNVPDYPGMAGYWWQAISLIIEGELSVTDGMNALAEQIDQHLIRLQDQDLICGPKVNKQVKPSIWLNKPGSPKQLMPEEVKGKSLPFEEAINAW